LSDEDASISGLVNVTLTECYVIVDASGLGFFLWYIKQ